MFARVPDTGHRLPADDGFMMVQSVMKQRAQVNKVLTRPYAPPLSSCLFPSPTTQPTRTQRRATRFCPSLPLLPLHAPFARGPAAPVPNGHPTSRRLHLSSFQLGMLGTHAGMYSRVYTRVRACMTCACAYRRAGQAEADSQSPKVHRHQRPLRVHRRGEAPRAFGASALKR